MIDLSGTRIPIPGTSNLRDVGGIATTDGRTIASGRLLRSEVLAHAGAASVHSIWSDVNA
ncbi:MAG: protein-tyrosine-phosphatase, partial [Actinobacteria bacterium]|nr:protein-tyrosine-phosphatase [Actinomycetota bacterium]